MRRDRATEVRVGIPRPGKTVRKDHDRPPFVRVRTCAKRCVAMRGNGNIVQEWRQMAAGVNTYLQDRSA